MDSNNRKDGSALEVSYYRYCRDHKGNLVPVDVARQNGRLVPRFPPTITEPYFLPDEETPDYLELVGAAGAGGRGGRGGGEETYPPEYRTGIGADGVNALKTFVQKGGTLVTLGAASNFAIERLGLSLRNVLANKTSKEFWCPGSTLKVKVDNTNPWAYGMPADALAVFLSNSPAFEITPTGHNEDYEVVVRYVDRDLLQSGWLIGEDNLAKKAAMVSAKLGAGHVVLIGFRAQHRAQTHGTFKLLFNALLR